MQDSKEGDRLEHKATLNFDTVAVDEEAKEDTPSVGSNSNGIGEGQLSSQNPVLRIKLLIDVAVNADKTQAVFASLD